MSPGTEVSYKKWPGSEHGMRGVQPRASSGVGEPRAAGETHPQMKAAGWNTQET